MKTITKTLVKTFMFFTVITLLTSCEKDESMEQFTDLNTESKEIKFDFDQFGKTHNAYLEYVWNFEERANPEARFKYGKTFVDPTFGSFDTNLTWQELDKSIGFHKRRVDQILNGKYNANEEGLSPAMTKFLNNLATTVKSAVDKKLTVGEFAKKISEIEKEVYASQKINIDLERGVSNDGASMLAISSILKYSVQYWTAFDSDGDNGDDTPMARRGIWRALADAWGYVSAWTDNGDGSYSWDHDSALVNADCVSDKVREN